MGVEEQWDLLRKGHQREGLAMMQESFVSTPTPSTLITLGLGYLWAERYEAARDHFQDWMQKYAVTADAYFALIGVSQWCLDDFASASESWKSGLGAQYLDMAGGTEVALLLWCSSIFRRDLVLEAEAERILEKKAKSPKAKYWPGPLAQFILSQIDEEVLREVSADRLHRKVQPRQAWQIDFYKQISGLERGCQFPDSLRRQMQELVDLSGSRWSEEQDFLQLVRNPEFYIARHEAFR